MTRNLVSISIGLALTLLATGKMHGAEETYIWKNVAIGGGGFVTGVEFHPYERGLAYARTDVGGAYRWDEAAGRWTPLLDWLGQPDWNLQGVESLALDPNDPDRIYLACGTYTRDLPEIGNGAILRSRDRGTTWARTPLPFKLGANESARGSGERLMVDPNQPSHLYFGTRCDGLWQSTDYGATWARVRSFPEVPDDSINYHQKPGERFNYLAQPVGIVWVHFAKMSGDHGAPTPVVYAAVSRTGVSIFRSTNAGKSWTPLPNQPTAFRPTGAALAPEGTLYVTYGDEPGPSSMHNGAVWKFDPRSETWTELTPEKPKPTPTASGFGYAGICVDPADSKTLLVSTWGRRTPYDEIFRSADAGKSWRPLLATATWDHSSAPYTKTMTHHWLSDLEIDPFNRDRIVFNTGYGLWASTNATTVSQDQPSHWVFFNTGLEETVPLTLISPPVGAPLISGVGDIDGFVHDDLSVSPPNGRFAAPGYKNTEWLDYAGAQPTTIVRSGTTYSHDRIHAAISDDSGITWATLATEPPHPNDPKPFTTGPVAISADGKLITWTPHGGAPFFTADRGKTWRKTSLPVDTRVIGDRVDPSIFYGFDAVSGALYTSMDAGTSFTKTQSGPTTSLRRRGGPEPVDLAAVPGRLGEVWLATGGQLYHLTARGQNLSSFPKLSEVGAVGFGKAAPDAEHPAVFVTATIAGMHGIFRSDDTGITWIKLTDDYHQFGSASRLTGDPRIFGRVYFCTGGRGIVYGERSAVTSSIPDANSRRTNSSFALGATTTWEKSVWQGESVWVSSQGALRAVVTEARSRLIYFGSIDGSFNLLNAPYPQVTPGKNNPSPNQGGHRFWLGPQNHWVWPPLTEWEYAAVQDASSEAGVLTFHHAQLNKEYPAITREYAWEGKSLRCTARWQNNGQGYFGMHVVAVNTPFVITAHLKKTKAVPTGLVVARMVDREISIRLPHPSIEINADTATVRSGIKSVKLGFSPQSLTIDRPHGWKLSVEPGPSNAATDKAPDQGYLSQVWVGDKTHDLAELEQLTPYLKGDDKGSCSSTIYLEATPPAH